MNSQRAFTIVPLLIVIVLVSIGSIVYVTSDREEKDAHSNSISGNQNESEFNSETTMPESGGINVAIAAKLTDIERQLNIAKRSGGMSEDRFAAIGVELKDLERAGADAKKIALLRELLNSIPVGGLSSAKPSTPQIAGTTLPPPSPSPLPSTTYMPPVSEFVTWGYDGGFWKPSRKAPECSPLVYESPVDLTKATSILYPGQIRGTSINDYKSHGGVRFDNQYAQNIEVHSPADGFIWRGSRLLVNGKIQYGFDIIEECGVLHRLGHLYELSPRFQTLVAVLPAPKEGDSRTTELRPYQKIKKGELIATKIGLPESPGVDWGVMDLRKENAAAADPAYRDLHKQAWYYDYHGLCWLDLLTSDQKAIAKSLPAGDGKMGKTSDYCK